MELTIFGYEDSVTAEVMRGEAKVWS